MREVHKAKAEFVSRYLQPLLTAADPKIRRCVYTTTESGHRVIGETVNITREQRDFTEKTMEVNVTGDSEKALLLDVMKTMAKEWRLA